jgi:hypothetical protein
VFNGSYRVKDKSIAVYLNKVFVKLQILCKYAVPLRLVLISSAAHHCQTWKEICCLNSAAVVQVCSKKAHINPKVCHGE